MLCSAIMNLQIFGLSLMHLHALLINAIILFYSLYKCAFKLVKLQIGKVANFINMHRICKDIFLSYLVLAIKFQLIMAS